MEPETREGLGQSVLVGKAAACKIRHANGFPAADRAEDCAAALGIVDTCSPATGQRVLKKNEPKPWRKKMWRYTAGAKRRVRLRDGKHA
jgi:hypothetical protein